MKQRFLTALLLVLPLLASAYDCQVDGIYYNIIPKGKVAEVTFENTSYNSYSGKVVIPEKFTYDGIDYSVASIGDYAFKNSRDLTSVTTPNSVTTIGNRTFEGCSSLTLVTIPNSVTSIGWSVFSGCSSLTSVNIPNSVTSIGGYAFSGCSGLTSVIIPNSVTTIGENAFYNCSGLTSVTIPNSVTTIGNLAFQNCSSLTSVTIPNSVTNIGNGAFYGCSGLTSVHITDLTAWCKILFGDSYSSYSMWSCVHHLYLNGEEIKDLVIPNSVTTIGENVFSGCSSLTSVTIPNSVTSIGNSAFSYCSGLTSLIIPNSVTSIGSWAFSYCSGLTSLIIPNSVTSIGSWAFEKCSKLEEVYCLAEIVPSTFSNAFNGSYPEYMTLYVPASALDEYKRTSPWSSFGTILPIEDGTAIEATTCDTDMLISFNNGKITVNSEAEGQTVNAYTMGGKALGTGIICNGKATIQTNQPAGEPFIVKAGTQSVKMLMK